MEWPPKWTFANYACPLSADIFAKSRKSNNPKNLAKVDPWTSLLLAANTIAPMTHLLCRRYTNRRLRDQAVHRRDTSHMHRAKCRVGAGENTMWGVNGARLLMLPLTCRAGRIYSFPGPRSSNRPGLPRK